MFTLTKTMHRNLKNIKNFSSNFKSFFTMEEDEPKRSKQYLI
jgi:hypothetical protein